jgi:hypothetical protein
MRLRTILAATLISAAVALVSPFSPSASGAPTWAPAATAAIHPGVQMVSESGQCTANFVFTNGTEVLLGFAAHCIGTGAATETKRMRRRSLGLGTPVEIDGASQPGTVVYSSWLAMQAVGESNADTCDYNDLALVRINGTDAANVNPSIPHWGGPTGLNTTGNPASPACTATATRASASASPSCRPRPA